ncbi:MAG TPA: hypothetical protein VM867_05315 [Xanthobacteraceae bacterium]|nr:hypothetical protein [Xanthobacteraceae bacterium]
MPVFLLAAGILLCVIGFFLIGFFIPNRDFSVGGTFILAGSVAVVGGLVLIGISAAIRELRNLAKALEKGPVTTARPAPSAPPRAAAPASVSRPQSPAPPPPTPVPVPRPGASVNTARHQRAEPRLDTPASDAAAEPPAPSAPTVADVTATRPRAGLFASIRGRAAVEAAMDSKEPQAPALASRPADIEPPDFEPPADDQPPQRPSSLSALAARTAARLDLPRPVPDLPRAAPEPPFTDSRREEEPEDEEIPPEKPARNVFDTVWPNEGRSDAERKGTNSGADRQDDIPPLVLPPEPEVEILKSGVIDGMAYTLYTDGSIEAQLPQGTLRFTSIDDLRAHLERN